MAARDLDQQAAQLVALGPGQMARGEVRQQGHRILDPLPQARLGHVLLGQRADRGEGGGQRRQQADQEQAELAGQAVAAAPGGAAQRRPGGAGPAAPDGTGRQAPAPPRPFALTLLEDRFSHRSGEAGKAPGPQPRPATREPRAARARRARCGSGWGTALRLACPACWSGRQFRTQSSVSPRRQAQRSPQVAR